MFASYPILLPEKKRLLQAAEKANDLSSVCKVSPKLLAG